MIGNISIKKVIFIHNWTFYEYFEKVRNLFIPKTFSLISRMVRYDSYFVPGWSGSRGSCSFISSNMTPDGSNYISKWSWPRITRNKRPAPQNLGQPCFVQRAIHLAISLSLASSDIIFALFSAFSVSFCKTSISAFVASIRVKSSDRSNELYGLAMAIS